MPDKIIPSADSVAGEFPDRALIPAFVDGEPQSQSYGHLKGHIREGISGGVSPEALAALMARSDAGDDLQAIAVVSEASLTTALGSQATADTGLVLHFASEVTSSGVTYPRGLVGYVAPRSRAVESWFTISGNVPHARVDGSGKVTEGLFTQAILDYVTQGDSPIVHAVAGATTLRAHLSNQPGNEHPLWLRITRDFRVAPNDYAAREVWTVPPRSNTPVKLLDALPYLGRVDILPANIAAAADLGGAYQITLSDIQHAELTARGVNAVEIWFKDQPIEEITNWSPKETAVWTATVDTSEETQIGLTGSDTIIPIRAVFRRRAGGSSTYVAQIGTWLTVGGQSQSASTAQIQAAVNAYLQANPPPAGEDSVARAAAAKNAEALTAVNAAGWVRETRLSPTLQAALLDLRVPPVREAIAGAYTIVFANGGILRSDFYYAVEANGVTVVPRKQWDSPASITFTPTADQARRMAARDPGEVTVVVTFYPSIDGLELTNHARVVAVRPTQAAPAPAADTDVGGAFNIGTRSIWHGYDINEDLDPTAWYVFLLRDGGSERYVPTQPWRGDFPPVNAGGAFTQGEDNQMGLIIARAEADGARVLSVTRTDNKRRLFLSTNSSWNVHKLVKLA